MTAPVSRRGALGIAAAGALASCVSNQARADRVSFWAMSTEGENVPLLLPDFTRETGINVDVQALPWTAAHQKLLTAYAGGSLPDVMMVNNRWIAELAMVGAIAPLAAAAVPDADQFATLTDWVRIHGRPHGAPWVADAQAQFYRRDLVAAAGHAEPPADWAAWKAMAHRIKRRAPDSYAVLMLLDWPEQLFNFAAQHPDRLLRDHDTRGNFSSPAFKATLAFYKSMFDDGLAPRVVGTDVGDTLAAFHQGWFALLPANATTIGDLVRRAPKIPRASWAVCPMPGPDGPARGAMVDGSSLVVSRTARDPERAQQLVSYLCRPATQLGFYALTGDLPTRPSAWEQSALAHDPIAQTFARQLAHGVAPPAVPEWERIVTDVQAIAERMVRGQLTVDAAAAAMDARADELLAKRRWLFERGRIAA